MTDALTCRSIFISFTMILLFICVDDCTASLFIQRSQYQTPNQNPKKAIELRKILESSWISFWGPKPNTGVRFRQLHLQQRAAEKVRIKEWKRRKDLNILQGNILKEDDLETRRLAVRVFVCVGAAEDVFCNSTKMSYFESDECPICFGHENENHVWWMPESTVML
jgi:hypothetical protein